MFVWTLATTFASSSLLVGSVSANQVPLRQARSNTVITPDFSAWVEKRLPDRSAGFALGVVRLADNEDEPPHFEFGTWGVSDEHGTKVTPETLFHIGSCSKAFLTASVGILIDDFASGKNVTPLPTGLDSLSWDTKLQDILPGEWKLQDDWASKKANLRDIFSHVTGLPRHDGMYGLTDTPQDILHKLQYLKPTHELRERWSYNNLMYMVGADIVGRYSGMPYPSFVASRILEPVGMNYSTLSPSVAHSSGLSQTWNSWGRAMPFLYTDDEVELIAGAGGIMSNLIDMTKWAVTLLHSGVNPDTNNTVIPRSAFDEATTAHHIMRGTPSGPASIVGYGLGWGRQSYHDRDVFWHTGGLPGFTTYVMVVPELRAAIVNFVNADNLVESLNLAAGHKALEILMASHENDDAVTQPQELAAADLDSSPSPSFETISEPPALTLSAYAGTYTNAAYGPFTLCAPTEPSTSDCDALRADFRTVDEHRIVDGKLHGTASQPGHELLLRVDKLFFSEARLVPAPNLTAVTSAGPGHNASMTFGFRATALFPEGHGEDGTPFERADLDEGDDRVLVEFVEREGEVVGLGLFDYGDGADLHNREGEVEERAYAWFKKV